MREHDLGYRETARKCGIVNSVITKWELKYLEEGYEGLMKDNHRRPTAEKNAFVHLNWTNKSKKISSLRIKDFAWRMNT